MAYTSDYRITPPMLTCQPPSTVTRRLPGFRPCPDAGPDPRPCRDSRAARSHCADVPKRARPGPLAVWKCHAAGAGRTPPPQQSTVESTGEAGLSRAIRVINRFSACLTGHELLRQTRWFAGFRKRSVCLTRAPPTHIQNQPETHATYGSDAHLRTDRLRAGFGDLSSQ